MKLNTYIILGALVIAGCTAGKDNTGLEFSPQMYHGVSYEPLSQITDKEQGRWLSMTNNEGHAEFYHLNPYNTSGMSMRTPVANTVKRGQYIIPKIAPDDFESAALLVNPLQSSEDVVKNGKALYERFCDHCHGKDGMGDGKVGQVFKGVTSYTSASVVDKPEGHIYHVITHGKGRMGSHASQLSPEERWKIAMYVKVLQTK